MDNFNLKQKIVNIAGTKIGGQPGEHPTVMCGSIFYTGHGIVTNPQEGVFDKDAARKLLSDEARQAKEFGLPRIIDVIGETGRALIKYLQFILEETECPILVDSTNTKAILEAFCYFKGSKAMQRLIYNSIDPYYKEGDLQELKTLGVKNAVVLAFTVDNFNPADRLALLLGDDWQRDSGWGDGLLAKIKAAGIGNITIDVGVLDLYSIALSTFSIGEIKEKIGLPCGCAPANALFNWQRDNSKKIAAPNSIAATGAAAYSAAVYGGADWILYGPVSCAEWAYPAVSVADSIMSGGTLWNQA